jgi:hypothetical protein
LFDELLFSYFKNEAELALFNIRIMQETDIKIEMMNACKDSLLLFFEEKIVRFIKGYEMTKTFASYKNNCEEGGYNALSNKTFGLRLCNVVNKLSTTKNKTHCR